MGAIQRMMAHDIACKTVPADFSLPPGQRRLFPEIEPDVIPDGAPESEELIRNAVVHLHEHILGRFDSSDDPEVARTFQLFTSIYHDAHQQEQFDSRESYFCRSANDERVDDPHYTIRAWRGVVTYLLRQHEFLYE